MPSDRRTFLKTGITAAIPAFLSCRADATISMNDSFLERNGDELTLNGTPFTMVGTNNFWMSFLHQDQSLVDSVIETANNLGFNMIRTWGFGSGSPLLYQPEPGELNEDAFQRMDYIIKQASDHGLKLVLSLVNYWADYGGMDQYVKWSSTATERDDFYTDPETKEMYRNYVRKFLTRTNTYTGREYREEPAIAIWELTNEARHPSSPDGVGDTLHSWMDEMAGYVKNIDKNHLVSTGSEGFVLGEGSIYDNAGYWMNSEGSDFVGVHQSSNIDVASFHLYPDHFGISKESACQFIKDRADDAKEELNKPVYLGEFGRAVYRDSDDVKSAIRFRNEEYNTWYQIMDSKGVNGSLVWQLVDDSLYGNGADEFSVFYPRDASTLELLEQEARNLTANLSVRVDDATNVSQTEATLNGIVLNFGENSSVTSHFEYRPKAENNWTATPEQSLSSPDTFSNQVTNLEPATEYEFRVRVVASDGNSASSSTKAFTTHKHTLIVDGSSSPDTLNRYSFTVSENVEKSSSLGSIQNNDNILGRSVTGEVLGGKDGYRFTGDVTEFEVKGNPAVYLDGDAVAPDNLSDTTYPNTITLDGSPAPRQTAKYAISVDGKLKKSSVLGSINSYDTIEGGTASGRVVVGKDGYRFTGSVTELIVNGKLAILLTHGDRESTSGESGSNMLVVDGTETPNREVKYSITISGNAEKDGSIGSINAYDTIESGTISGRTVGGKDAYKYSGQVMRVEIDGPAIIRFEDADE